MSREESGSVIANVVAGFAALAITIGAPVAAVAWSEAQREEATRIKPVEDSAYSPQRLKECRDDDAKRAAQGKPAQLCWPDLVVR